MCISIDVIIYDELMNILQVRYNKIITLILKDLIRGIGQKI